LRDIGTFELNRSRIPTALFKSIVQDIDMMLVQYGPPTDHETEEATIPIPVAGEDDLIFRL
jgi:hypothetical protein